MKYLFTSDWHLRDTAPKCRTDNFMSAQWKKLAWLANRPEVKIVAGDIFHQWFGHPTYQNRAHQNPGHNTRRTES